MGNLDRLLEALARQLPPSAPRHSIVAALHEAVKALPESQAKTRKRFEKDKQTCITKLEELVKEQPAEVPTEVHEDAASDAGAQDDPALAAYAGVSEDDPAACVARSAELVSAALTGLRPAKLVESAFEGLLAVLPSGKISIKLETLQRCMQLVPTASAVLGDSEPPAWSRFLGFLLTALAGLKGVKASTPASKDAKDVAARLGGIIVLSSGPVPARAALRHGLSALDEASGAEVLARLAPAFLPIAAVAFGGVSAWEHAPVVRSDLIALLHALRFVGLCRKQAVGEMRALNEASDLLRSALEKHFHASTIVPKLKSMGLGASKRRKVDSGASEANGRAGSAKFVSEAIIAASSTLGAAAIFQIANASGLPIGEDEEDSDRKAAAARARGDLFFEDLSGNDFKEASAGKMMLELDGVEALNTASKKRKRGDKAKSGAEAGEDEVGAEAA